MIAAPSSSTEATTVASPVLEATLFDPSAFGVVLAGTLMATLARAGVSDTALAARSAIDLARSGFDQDANRTAVARWARAIKERGVLGAETALPPDADIARAMNALVRTGSIKALQSAHEASQADIRQERSRGVRVFEQAGELAPVFGLVGTLFSMTQLTQGVGAETNALTLGAIATAVLSSLYGVVLAHFLFVPLGHGIARRTQRETDARERLVAWFANEIADAVPGGAPSSLTPLKTVA